ncbi:nucleotidyl transferase AbiEii/AbiGii toxin family protein [Maribrevibacterium harenarium]|uniref:Nucleotidyl transferase AbiEii/AbiGii toxin family protein n=1 Tax=Maribrevibacterium harenarium TaxID=2589817 RepID=A0A501X4H8_9GAMM|nr:nucleotidyl transferase AbiEii/AbiGii toxin family protein [Maribrevibacterium harenarium]TPE55351.1 nucleotidyl transferase AbiEii/AbiGii toxin family protein [Maribrevibacterium harenarium]
MSTNFDNSLFVDIADAIGLGNPAIVEKDYYVVELLKLISTIDLDYHQIVFSGGTALAKSAIKTYRMSEDIDLKLVPKPNYPDVSSRNAGRNARKKVKQRVELLLEQSRLFSIEGTPDIKNEYRYSAFEIKYPQAHQQAPCLRPFIKLELIESTTLSPPEKRRVQSIYSEVLTQPDQTIEMDCAAIIDTQAEKLVSMLRRTASSSRNQNRVDDEALIRHVYDTYHIQMAEPSNIKMLATLVSRVIKADIQQYGNQHSQLVESPLDELSFGLEQLLNNKLYAERYNKYVSPMVYAEHPVSWQDALAVFNTLAHDVFKEMT